MARRLRIRQAIERATRSRQEQDARRLAGVREEETTRTPPASVKDVPGHQGHSTRPEGSDAPAGTGEGAFRTLTPLHYQHWSARQLAGLDYLRGAPMRRWGWLFPPFSADLFKMAPALETPALILGCTLMKIELKTFRAKMALSMWISQLAIIRREYTLWRVGQDDGKGPHP